MNNLTETSNRLLELSYKDIEIVTKSNQIKAILKRFKEQSIKEAMIPKKGIVVFGYVLKCFEKGMTIKEISEIFGISEKQVNEIVK